MFGILDISTSGLVAQRIRMDVIHGNIANAQATQRADGWRLRVRMKTPADSPQKQFRDYLVIPVKDHPKDVLRVLCYYVRG